MSPTTADPSKLSLKPSQAIGGGPDFSNVQGHADTVPGGGGSGSARSPEFAHVQDHADSVPGGGGGGGGGGVQTYTVRAGDTLSHIAQQHYGKASHWHAIFDANRDQIDNPDLIRPGQVLKLPALDH
ncbi:LysM peptidoglycan-binding domain-containing protein [Cognatiluteimonas telluris]|jgi:nucleoid-associated protein YgaU|uniref:LysM peptidoglycan-binding domain-containing protein n=1 Tax=Cognatiluteimonas telluris TaxID=1104775 RepID=UPI001409AA8A|nr:LysM peptidoglycan-binding domain-containing protein [Lysobacter telluris]